MNTWNILTFHRLDQPILKYFHVPSYPHGLRSGFLCKRQRSLPISLGRFLFQGLQGLRDENSYSPIGISPIFSPEDPAIVR
jgi:hypothetical protein